MIQAISHTLEALSERLQQEPDFIIIGEMHGSKQNAALIHELLFILLNRSNPITVAFEWELTDIERETLRDYIQGGEIRAQLPNFFLDSDGRFTMEHISLLKWIRMYNSTHNNRIDLHTFVGLTHNKEPDQTMADSLLVYKKQHPESLVLVETGNMHARNSPFIFAGAECVPMAAILKKEYSVFSVFLRYVRGEILVEGESKDVTSASSQREDVSSYFDAMIDLPVSESAQNPSSLTEISQLLQS